ncbi:unnamed protein product [Closterium sp. Naga37s-1]|nr:unnamed protein product [Closterium sp. Naga37s-1]
MGGCVSIEEDPRGRVGPAPSRSSSRATHSNRVAPQSPSTASKRLARKSSPMRSPSSASASASAYRSGGLLPKSNESNASAASAGSGSGRRSCPQTPRGGSGGGFRTPPGSGGLGSGRRGGALADRTALANGGAAISSLREFSYQELFIATRKFEKEGKLGEGGFGSVFRGTIEEDVCASGAGVGAGSGESGRRKVQVAVKVLNQGGQQGETEWKTEVRYLSELRHPNLVRLVGYCSDGHHRLLAYEYLPYGSLERFLFTREFLFAPSSSLPWAVRMKVALHAAVRPLAFIVVLILPPPPPLPPRLPPSPGAIQPLPWPVRMNVALHAAARAIQPLPWAVRMKVALNAAARPLAFILVLMLPPPPPLDPPFPSPPGPIQPLPWAVRMKVALHAAAVPVFSPHSSHLHSLSPLAPLLPFPPAGAIQPLPWAVRMKVALHAAQGLAYLHEEADRQIIYRDFKASNILLDEDFNAKLSDFGLAKDGPEGNQTHVSTRVMGTYGYAAPEYMMTGHLTAKSRADRHSSLPPSFPLPSFPSSSLLPLLTTSPGPLSQDFNAKLSDFGLAKDGPEGNQTHVSTRVMGTYGYAAPEYMMTGHLTAKSDVYSFGVVLLEMISGRRAMEPEFPKRQQNIVEWARPFLVDPAKMLLLVDPRVGGEYSVKGAQRAAVLARKCLNKDPHARPLMSESVRVLSSIQNLTDFASKLEQAQRLHGA